MSSSSSSSNSSNSSNSPCAACKFLRRKCVPSGCIFAPYFPPENPTKFIHVHRVFGASNVSKLLNELPPSQREDAVNSLAYEAEARLHDPVLGCVGYIALLQHRLMQLQRDLSAAKRELSLCIYAGQGSASTSAAPMYRDHQYQQQQQMMMVEIEQLAEVAAAERAAEAALPLIGGFEGSIVELQQQQQGLQGQEGSGFGVHNDFQQRRRGDEGRSGEGPSA